MTSSATKSKTRTSNVKSAPMHPLLKAFMHAEYGSLSVQTPEGATLEMEAQKPGPAASFIIHDWLALDEGIARGEIGFAEGYIQKKWDSRDLTALITFLLLNTDSLERYFYGRPLYAVWVKLKNWFSSNTVSRSRKNVVAHYDLGNDFYALWLDKSMTYSSALFADDDTRSLEEAQQAKYQRILSKLNAKPGDTILEIGCGWGGFAEMAATQGFHVTGITLSDEQANFARRRMQASGLSDRVSIELTDYRKVEGAYDHIVSIGMFEHVGQQYWSAYFETIRKLLKPTGKAMVQSITLDDVLFERLGNKTGFIEHYIFPGGMLPSKQRFRDAAEKAGLQCNQFFAFGQHYAKTLQCWLDRFEAHKVEVRELGYDENFIRMWRFYLSACIASFITRRTDVMQAELILTNLAGER